MFFFLPVGDENSTRRVPWMTYLLILVNVLVFLMVATRPDYQSVVNEYGFRPDQPSFGDALTSAFLHAGILHLIGNMLYLWIVGDNVEDTLGAFGFLAFYLGGAVAADYVHMAAVSPGLVSLPTIGASGAVAAVLGAYLLLFPTHAIRYWGIILIQPVSFKVPAVLALGMWFVLEVVAQMLSGGHADVAYGAHIGGFIAGFAAVGMLIIAGLVVPSWARPAPAPAPAAEPKHLCPACAKPMRPVTVRDVEVDECPFCAGLWFEPGELEETYALPRLPRRLYNHYAIDNTLIQKVEGQRSCPYCQQPFLLVDIKGTTTEVCPACHGVWLERGELGQLFADKVAAPLF